MSTTQLNFQVTELETYLKPFAMRFTRDMDEAKDLLQETMLKAVVHQDKFMEGTNLKAWLYTILKNTFITRYNRETKKNTFIDRTENQYYMNSSSHSVKNRGEGNFLKKDIEKAMKRVKDDYTQPFQMYFNGYKYHEIADTLSIPIGTVKNRIHIARKKLQEELSIYKIDN